MSAVVEDARTSDAPTPTGGTRGGARRWLMVALVFAVLATIVSTALWVAERSQNAVRDDVARAAGEFVASLTTWDATGGLDATRNEIAELGTGDLLAELDAFFAGPDVVQLVAVQARSEGAIDGLAVEVDGETALAFAEAEMRLSDSSGGPSTTLRQQIRLELVLSDGRWLVSAFETAAYDAPAPTADGGP